VTRYIDDNDVPFRQPGDEKYVDAADFWNALPVLKRSEIAKARGGK